MLLGTDFEDICIRKLCLYVTVYFGKQYNMYVALNVDNKRQYSIFIYRKKRYMVANKASCKSRC